LVRGPHIGIGLPSQEAPLSTDNSGHNLKLLQIKENTYKELIFLLVNSQESSMDGRSGSHLPKYTIREGDNTRNTNKKDGIGDPLRQRETAQYVADMILELRNLAKSARLYQVMVPLEYAYYEAFAAANRVEVPAEEVDRLRELSRSSEDLEPPPPETY
jgi:hypothetical protein